MRSAHIAYRLVPGMLLLAALVMASAASAATFTVTNTNDSGAGSLRQALLDANANGASSDTIAFAIPGAGPHTISPATNLPSIDSALVIDGYTQPGASANSLAIGNNAVLLIELAGGSGANTGLFVRVPSVTIRGLVLNRFGSSAIGLFGGGSDDIVIEGNFVGTNPAGTGSLPNHIGVAFGNNFGGPTNSRIGGTTPAARNVISGNSAEGISISDFATGNIIAGNYIGTNRHGTGALPNGTGVAFGGGSGTPNTSNTIGGTTSAAANVISGNTGNGITLAKAESVTIRSNLIGVSADGVAPLGNGLHGVSVGFAAGGFFFGGPNHLVWQNTIAHNGGSGVRLIVSGPTELRRNSIHSNGQLGFDLAGNNTPDANDAGDADTGPNDLQNFPVISNVNVVSGTATIQGTLQSAASTAFRLDFFGNAACDPSGHGEGQTYLGSTNVTTDGAGMATFSTVLPLPTGQAQVTSTATAPSGATSEFSQCFTTAPGTLAITGTVTRNGNPLPGVLLTLSGSASMTTTTAANGTYAFSALPSGATYTITPSLASHAFSPPMRTFSSQATDAVADFTATRQLTIAGQVVDLNDTGISGVQLSLGGTQTGTTTTDSDGRYTFTGLALGGSYTVTPSLTGFTFQPTTRAFDNLQDDQLADFSRFLVTSGIFRRYFAEGATGTFFDTSLALLNATDTPAQVHLEFQKGDATVVTRSLTMPPLSRVTVAPEEAPELASAEFSTLVQADVPVIADRTMRWDASGYGSHAETSIAAPALTWYLAEGATIGGFSLFYLLQNPGSTPADVRITYLLPAPEAPLVRTYTVAAKSRFNVWANVEDLRLAAAEVSAVIEVLNGQPIIVERAMYRDGGGQVFRAGHASAGITTPSATWFLAEGNTGPYFDLFVLIANPTSTDAQVTATYLLPDGTTQMKSYLVPANSRFNIWLDQEELPAGSGLRPLADTAVSTTIMSTNSVPLIVERAMWWPGTADTWHEGHNSPGATVSGTKWGLADGEVGGAFAAETYVLIANTSSSAGSVRVTLYFEDGTTAQRTFSVPGTSRFNVAVGTEFAEAAGKRFGAIVESLGSTPAQIVVERAMYSSAQGVPWAAGTAVVGTRLR